MKKIITILVAGGIMISAMQSCTSMQGTTGSTVSTIGSGLINLLGPYLLRVLGNIPSLKGVMSNATLNTQLNTLLKSPTAVNDFKNAISTNFSIPMGKINSAYSGFGTLNDVTNFIAQNGDLSVLTGLK